MLCLCIAKLPIALALKMFVLFSFGPYSFSGVGVWCSWHSHICDNILLLCMCGIIIYMHGTNYNIRIYFCNLLHTIRSSVMEQTFHTWMAKTIKCVTPKLGECTAASTHSSIYVPHITLNCQFSPLNFLALQYYNYTVRLYACTEHPYRWHVHE